MNGSTPLPRDTTTNAWFEQSKQHLHEFFQNKQVKNWSRITVEVKATNESKISNVESKARAKGGQIGHGVTADNKSTIEGIKLDSDIS